MQSVERVRRLLAIDDCGRDRRPARQQVGIALADREPDLEVARREARIVVDDLHDLIAARGRWIGGRVEVDLEQLLQRELGPAPLVERNHPGEEAPAGRFVPVLAQAGRDPGREPRQELGRGAPRIEVGMYLVEDLLDPGGHGGRIRELRARQIADPGEHALEREHEPSEERIVLEHPREVREVAAYSCCCHRVPPTRWNKVNVAPSKVGSSSGWSETPIGVPFSSCGGGGRLPAAATAAFIAGSVIATWTPVTKSTPGTASSTP